VAATPFGGGGGARTTPRGGRLVATPGLRGGLRWPAATPKVAPTTYGVARGHPSCFLGWPYGHPIFFLGWLHGHPRDKLEWPRATPEVAEATSRGGSQATWPPQRVAAATPFSFSYLFIYCLR